MKKIIFSLILVTVLMSLTGCKKNEDVSVPIRISYFDIRPQIIGDNESAWITVTVSNIEDNFVLVKSLADYGITNPAVTSTTGNPIYIEYIPPKLNAGQTQRVNITVLVMDLDGKELDRIEGQITVED
ncbi:MAG: hypothetical protein MUF15_07785 [Acidobacteria bacterium]|jgi:hypothetical protein|nr:hypothetical protein [Acidobacteriota bacterium]